MVGSSWSRRLISRWRHQGLRDDLLMTEQAAQFTLKFGRVGLVGKAAMSVCPITVHRFAAVASETPLKGACRLILFTDKLFDTLTQVCGTGVTGMENRADWVRARLILERECA
jgi:hypothetical protein